MLNLTSITNFETRSKGGYKPFKNNGEKFKKSVFPYFSDIWNSLHLAFQCKNIEALKFIPKRS